MQAAYVRRGNSNTVYVVANDTIIYLSLMNTPHYIRSGHYFQQ